MEPLRLRIKGVTVFEQAELDVGSVPGSLVALVGRNGAGKSTLLESIFASFYRFLPSRPTGLYAYCVGRDAAIEHEFAFEGTVYRTLVNVDAIGQRTEAYLFHDGKPLTSGKLAAFDAEVAARFGPAKLVLASAFAAQNKNGSFLELAKADRKTLFISMLALSRLQEISDAAAKQRTEAERLILALEGQEAELKRAAERRTPEPEIDDLKERIAAGAAELERMADRRLLAYDALNQARAASRAAEQAASERDAAQAKTARIEREVEDIRERTRQQRALSAKIAFLREAAARLAELRASTEALGAENQVLSDRAASLLDARHRWEIRAKEAANEADQRRLEAQVLAREVERSRREAATIAAVPCRAQGEFAACQFLVRATAAQAGLADLVDQAGRSQERAEAAVRTRDEITEPDRSQLEALQLRQRHVAKALEAARAEAGRLEAVAKTLAAAEQAEARAHELQLAEDAATARLREALAEADVLAERHGALLAATADAAALEREEAALGQRVRSLQIQIDSWRSDLARMEAEAEAVRAAQEKLRMRRAERAAASRERTEWALLEKAFGKTGIQSLELDCCGPAVSSIVNDLLFSCYGPRFAVRFATQVAKADGSGYKDEFDIVVVDSDRGREGSFDDLSGGEKVIVSEALALGIGLFNRARCGVGWDTLFRDECCGALYPEDAPRYTKLLRRAMEVGGFKRCFFVAHQPNVVETADSRIRIEEGRISVEG